MIIEIPIALTIYGLSRLIDRLINIKRKFNFNAILCFNTAVIYPIAYILIFNIVEKDTMTVCFGRFCFGLGILIVGSSIITGGTALKEISDSPEHMGGRLLASFGSLISWIILIVIIVYWIFWFITNVMIYDFTSP